MEAATSPTILNDFISKLSDQDLIAYDDATVNLSEATQHPDFLKHPLEGRRQFVREYLMHQVAPMKDIFHGLAPEFDNELGEVILQQILGPPDFKQTAGRAIHDIGVPLATGVGGALGAVGGSVPGAMLGGGMGYLAGDYLLRKLTDLPDPSLADTAGQTGLAMLGQGVDQGTFNLLSKTGDVLINGPVRSFMLGKNFTLTPKEHQSMLDLQRGSEALGREGTSQEATLTSGQILEARGRSNSGTFFENLMRHSFTGRTINKNQLTNNREAIEAMTARYVNSIGAVNDPRQAAQTMVASIKQRTTVAAQARRDAYQALGTVTRDIPSQNTESLLTTTGQKTRPDVQQLHTYMNRGIPPELAENLDDLLTTKATVGLDTLPVGTVQPGSQVDVQGNTVIYHGPGQTPGMSLVALDPLSPPQQIQTSMITVEHARPETSYAKLDQFSSLMGGIVRAAEEAQKSTSRGSAAEDLISAGRTASLLKHQADTILEGIHLPAEVRQARTLVRRIYAEENDTFYTPLIQGLVAKFKDSPDKFAATLLHPDNSDDLTKIHKAVESMPRFSGATILDPVARQLALDAGSQYTNGSRYWNRTMQPQLQAELVKEHLRTPGPGISGNQGTFERAVQASPHTLTPDVLRDTLFSMNADGLLKRLQDLTPTTRQVIFGTETQYQRLAQLAETLKTSQPTMDEGGKIYMAIKQSGSATTLIGAGAGILGGYATGNPYLVGAGALVGIVAPAYLVSKLTDAAFMKRLIFGVKHPTTSTAKRFFAEASRDMARIATAAGGEQLSKQLNTPPLPEIGEP